MQQGQPCIGVLVVVVGGELFSPANRSNAFLLPVNRIAGWSRLGTRQPRQDGQLLCVAHHRSPFL